MKMKTKGDYRASAWRRRLVVRPEGRVCYPAAPRLLKTAVLPQLLNVVFPQNRMLRLRK